MFQWLSSLHPRNLGRVSRAVFGEIHFSPPIWPATIVDSMHTHPGRWAYSIITGGLLYGAGMKSYDWWLAHRPRPREVVEITHVTASVNAPSSPTFHGGTLVPQRIEVVFSKSVAPMGSFPKEISTGFAITPRMEGKWAWASSSAVSYTPASHWLPGTQYVVTVSPGALSGSVSFKPNQPLAFSMQGLTVDWLEPEFYTDLKVPTDHFVSATIQTNYPVNLTELKSRLTLKMVSGNSVFADDDFSLIEAEGQETSVTRSYLFKSPRITIPSKEAFAHLELAEGLTASLGGEPLGAKREVKVRIPDAKSAFEIEGARATIIEDDDGEPEQILFITTNRFARTEDLATGLKAWALDLPGGMVMPPLAGNHGELNNKLQPYITPITLTPVESGEEAWAKQHAFKFLREKPGKMIIQIVAGTKGLGGFITATDWLASENIPAFEKEALITTGGILALNGERKVAIKTRGVNQLRITLGRVPTSQVNHLATFNEGTFESPSMHGVQPRNIAHFHREILPVPAKNSYQAVYLSYDFAAALARADASDPDASRGMFFVTVEGVEKRSTPDADESDPLLRDWNSVTTEDDSRFIIVTDLGLIAKRNASGTREIFVQSISQAAPAANVVVTVLATNGEILSTCTTDAEGHASLPKLENLRRERRPVSIMARLGNDVAFMPFKDESRQLELSRFETDGEFYSEQETLTAFLFSERGVYRPGDTANISAIVRRRDWGGALADMPVVFTLVNAKHKEIRRETRKLSADGFIEWKANIALTDPTGVYTAYLQRIVGLNDYEQLGRMAFRVEDFEPDRLKISSKLSSGPNLAWIAPKGIQAKVSLENLFGIPAAGNRMIASIDMSPAQFSFDAFKDYHFHIRKPKSNNSEDEESSHIGSHVDLGEQTTSLDGKVEFDLALERFAGGSFAMVLTVEGFEKDSGRSVKTSNAALVSAMPYAVGYKTADPLSYLDKDKPAAVRLICIGPDLKPVASPTLKSSIIQTRYVSVLTEQKNGVHKYVSTKREKVISDASLTITSAGISHPVPTIEPGDYRMELKDGDALVGVIHFTVVGKGDAGRSLDREAELELKLAQNDWKSGDALQMSLNAPYTGAGLITIERDKVLAWQWFKSPTTSSTQSIIVPPGLDGTGYVNVAFVRALDSPEVFTSPLSYAVQGFDANTDLHVLNVTVDCPAKVRPGEIVTIGHSAAETARVIVFAVDEGIHQITNYKRPTPLKHFMTKQALETDTWQMLDLLLPEFSVVSKQSAFGGDGEDALSVNLNPFQRKRDAPVAYWSGIVETGPQRRELSWQVPDYFNGSLKVMAVAVAATRLGSTESKSTVRGPMVLTPNAPTFVAPGDEFSVSLTVANNIDSPNPPTEVKLQASVSEQVELLDPAPAVLNVPHRQEATARFRVRARDTLGGATITFTATAGTESVTRKTTLSVRPLSPYATSVQSGYFRQSRFEVPLDRNVYPHFRKAEAIVTPMPIGLSKGLEAYLADYPHGCSEQITSRAMARLLLSSEIDFGFDQGESAKQIQSAIQQLSTRQNPDGGFGYWAGYSSAPSHDFLSLYVTWFLTEAKEAGHPPPPSLMAGSLKRMKQMARDEANLDYRAGAIYLLTRNGETTTNLVLNLRDDLDAKAWHGSLTAAFLGGTYDLLQQKSEGAKLLQDWWNSTNRKPLEKPWNGWWYEDTRVEQSLGLALLCRHLPSVARNFGYDDLKMITEPIREGHFNTITAATATLALKSFSQLVKQADVKLSISSSDQPGPESTGLGRTTFEAGVKALTFGLNQNGSDLGAFYQITESGFDRTGLDKAAANGLEIIRELPASASVGESINVTIHIRNISPDPLRQIALLDLFPGGFLPVTDGLKAGHNTIPGVEYVDLREDRAVFYLDLEKGQLKTISYPIKPVTKGTFGIPPIHAECMYDREVRGKGSAGKITVK